MENMNNMNSLERRRIYDSYQEMKLTYKNIVNANVKLVDKTKHLYEVIEMLQNKIDKAVEEIKENNYYDLLNILEYNRTETNEYEYVVEESEEN